ncbi:MAG TPA: SDR family oxidoreductase [Candidatus Acidoferrales bacterium]|nr:SDR family oxidoreductase [Candidatus Acidoferrales bacterium]
MNLRGRNAIVTGAARGLGLLVADGLAAEGVNIAGVDLRGKELQEEMEGIAARHSVRTLAFPADIGDEAAVTALVRHTVEALGAIDVLVNNAGIRETAPVWNTETAMWDRIHNSNLKGHFLCTREVLRQSMLGRGAGTLIFVSSGSGKKGEEDSSAYCASKWGILGFAESVAKDLKKTKIRVSSITPGMIETPMAHESEEWKLGLEWLDPIHVARAILYCIEQDPDTIIPELRIYHRGQV